MIWKRNLRSYLSSHPCLSIDGSDRVVRRKLTFLIEHWSRICLIAERILKRREAAAVRLPLSDASSTFLMHLPFFPSPSGPPLPSDPPIPPPSTFSDSASMLSSLSALSPFAAPSASPYFASVPTGTQADLSRLTLTLNVLTEGNADCWRGDACDLCAGVRHGLAQVSSHLGHHADNVEQRVGHCRVFSLFYRWLTSSTDQNTSYKRSRSSQEPARSVYWYA